jgi:hypothetical protein
MFTLYYANIKTVDKLPTRETAILVTNLDFENGAIFSKYLECPFNLVQNTKGRTQIFVELT